MKSERAREMDITVNAAKEIYEVAKDFEKPIEVLREALHNSYDASAKEVHIVCRRENLADGRDVLTIEIADDGKGMSEEHLQHFFSLGFSDKEALVDRRPIGFKGHGTKIYYQAHEILVLSKRSDGELLLAHLPDARLRVYAKELPRPVIYRGQDAREQAKKYKLTAPENQGTLIRLVDYTPNSQRLIDVFQQAKIENYLHWFTVFGSFEHVISGQKPQAPMRLFAQGTDRPAPVEIAFGHDWPESDRTDIKVLKQKDERRPFNFFCKTFRAKDVLVAGGYRVDIAVLIEGARGRAERDPAIRRQGRQNALYAEEERYGMWLCKDYLPVDRKFEWISVGDIFAILDIKEPSRALIFVNCQDFELTANRGSVGNSKVELLDAVRQATYAFLEGQKDDPDLKEFAYEYREEQFSRLREKDKKALQRRIERYNRKQYCTIQLPDGKPHSFYEPQREITLFGLISELRVIDPEVLNLNILDYDDHNGIDLLVRRNGHISNLLDKAKVAYTELKYQLTEDLNHPFESLYAIICWDCKLVQKDVVVDVTDEKFSYFEQKDERDGVTYAHLTPPPGSRYSHNIKVIVLKRLLEEKYKLQMSRNPAPIGASSQASGRRKGRK